MKHLSGIDGLRAIAVLAVVAYHAGLPVPAGFVGVDVFFVISGYLITRLLADEIRDTGRIDFLHFYARRARRILPAAVLVVVVTLALSFALLPSGRAEVARSAAAAAVFVANLHFQGVTGDYWAASSEQMPLLHLWSLSVEEQFYLLWPLLLLAVRRRPVPWLVGVAVASFVLAEALMWFNPTAAFYQMPARAWELALGGLVALRPVTLPRWSAGVGLAMVLLACFVPLPHFPGVGALPAVVGSALLIAAIHNGARVRVLELRPVVYVGLISYSLYLWHWPLLALDKALRVGESPLAARLALCVVAVLLAAMSYRYVEQPFRRSRARAGRAVAIGLACVVALSCAAFALADTQPAPAVNPTILASEVPGSACHNTMRDPVKVCAGPIIVWGDSMARAWSPLGIGNSRDACPPLLGYPAGNYWVDRRCREFSEAVLAKAMHAKVILVAAWTEYPVEDIRAGLAVTLGKLHGATIIGPTPILRDVMPRCLTNVAACAVPRAEFDAKAEPVRKVLRELAAQHGATYVEPVDYFCNAVECPALRNGKPLYFDDRHVSLSAVTGFRSLQTP